MSMLQENIKYELRKTFVDEKGEIQVTSVELKDFELDHMLFGMEDYYANLQYNELEPKTLDQWESEVSSILWKMGNL